MPAVTLAESGWRGWDSSGRFCNSPAQKGKNNGGKALHKKGAWKAICDIAQSAGLNRPPSAMYRHASRKWEWPKSDERQWGPDEQRMLLSLVDQEGQRWSLIGRQMGRSAEQVRDKWRSFADTAPTSERCWDQGAVLRLWQLVREPLP